MNASTVTRDTKNKPQLVFHHLPVKIFFNSNNKPGTTTCTGEVCREVVQTLDCFEVAREVAVTSQKTPGCGSLEEHLSAPFPDS